MHYQGFSYGRQRDTGGASESCCLSYLQSVVNLVSIYKQAKGVSPPCDSHGRTVAAKAV